MARRESPSSRRTIAQRGDPVWVMVSWAMAWCLALVMTAQAATAPLGREVPRDAAIGYAPAQAACCSGDSCCCGGPDVCLCEVHRPRTPLLPANHDEPARPVTERVLVSVLPQGEWCGLAMVLTGREGAVVRPWPRVVAPVRIQAVVGVWLT